MHRAYHNIVPVANKYLAHQTFIKSQKDHEDNVKNARGLIDLSSPSTHPHCTDRLKQKQLKEEHDAIIEHENERLRANMLRNGAHVDTHNHYVSHSLNAEKRHREQAQHEGEFQRLQKQMGQVRTNYPTDKYQHDFDKQQDFKRRIRKYPSRDEKEKKSVTE